MELEGNRKVESNLVKPEKVNTKFKDSAIGIERAVIKKEKTVFSENRSRK